MRIQIAARSILLSSLVTLLCVKQSFAAFLSKYVETDYCEANGYFHSVEVLPGSDLFGAACYKVGQNFLFMSYLSIKLGGYPSSTNNGPYPDKAYLKPNTLDHVFNTTKMIFAHYEGTSTIYLSEWKINAAIEKTFTGTKEWYENIQKIRETALFSSITYGSSNVASKVFEIFDSNSASGSTGLGTVTYIPTSSHVNLKYQIHFDTTPYFGLLGKTTSNIPIYDRSNLGAAPILCDKGIYTQFRYSTANVNNDKFIVAVMGIGLDITLFLKST